MRAFTYRRPRDVAEAVEHLEEAAPSVSVLAGGTDLVSLMKAGLETPEVVVSLRDVAALREVERRRRSLAIGAGVTLQQLMDHPELGELGGVVTACRGVRSPQIREQGTVGGDLLQRPRCWYFRNGLGLVPEPTEEPVDDRYHAAFHGGTQGRSVRFVCASSLAPIFVALQAECVVAGPSGERRMPVADLYRVPRREGQRETTLAPEELLVRVELPRRDDVRTATYEVRQRKALDWPLVSASVAIRLRRNGAVRDARIVLGHVAPTPWRAVAAEATLVGEPATAESIQRCSEAATSGADASEGSRYKVTLARVAVARALEEAMEVQRG